LIAVAGGLWALHKYLSDKADAHEKDLAAKVQANKTARIETQKPFSGATRGDGRTSIQGDNRRTGSRNGIGLVKDLNFIGTSNSMRFSPKIRSV
jgi:hypothetical protein